MKKLFLVLALVVTIAALVACGDSVVTTETPATTTGEVVDNSPVIESFADYTGTVDPAFTALVNNGSSLGAILEECEYFGVAKSVSNTINASVKGTKKWLLQKDDGSTEELSYTNVVKLGDMLVAVDAVKEGSTTVLTLKKIEANFFIKYSSITAKAGEYIMFDFASEIPANFSVTITAKAGEASSKAIYTETQISTETKSNKTTVGLAKFTVPHTAGKTYYLNLMLGTACVASMPIEVVEGNYDTSFCKLWITGSWEKIKNQNYLDLIIDEYYNYLPRLYARVGYNGTEAREIHFYLDERVDPPGAAWAYPTSNQVCVSFNFANNAASHRPDEVGYLAHEIAHMGCQFSGKICYSGHTSSYDVNKNGTIDAGETFGPWFNEQTASYFGLRYYHWIAPENVQLFMLEPAKNYPFDWSGYGNAAFYFAYVDWHYPSIDKNGNGKLDDDERGLLDSLVYMIKKSKTELCDNPADPRTPLNQKIAEVTEGKYTCFLELYNAFVEDFKSGAWVFTGFGDYQDNFITENIPGLENPNYPKIEPATPGNITNKAEVQNGVTAETAVLPKGENIAAGATVLASSGQHSAEEGVLALFDGKLDTAWRVANADRNPAYDLWSYAHGFVIDLGEVKTFDSYTVVNAGIEKPDASSMRTWEILISTDGKNFTSIDYQEKMGSDVVTVNVGEQSARYIEIRIFMPGATASSPLNLQELIFTKTN